MGFQSDYSHVPEWVEKPDGYKKDDMVKYEGNVFKAAFWSDKPGEGDAEKNGWRLYDELYDVTSSPLTEPAKIVAYIPTWRKKEKFNYANDEMYKNITHGIVSFLMFSETNLGEFEPTSLDDVNEIITDVVLSGHACGTKISIALGGATDYGFLYLMEKIGNNLSDPLLNRAVQKVVDFVESNSLDGVDLDLECWWDKNSDPSKDRGGRKKDDGPHPAGRGLTEFAKQLKQAMPDKTVSAALFATSWYGNNYDPELIDYLDWAGIMTYDLTGSWNASPVGPQTALLKIRTQEDYVWEQQGEWPGKGSADNPILSVEDSLWYWSNPFFTNWQGSGQNIPRNKIAAGVPIYGYDFAYGKEPDDLSGEIPPGYKVIRYKDILSQFNNAHTAANGNIKVSGSTPRPPFVSASGNYPYAHNIYLETPETATAKLNFLKNVGAQGVIIWELSNDVLEEGKSIIKALYKNSGNPTSRPPLLAPGKPGDVPTINWMKAILASKKLSELTIPGTHETCATTASNLVALPWTKCQDRGLKDQLNAGIRFLDIRCRHTGDTFAIHHGTEYQNLMFGDVLNDCINFLKANSSECIVMSVKEEHTPDEPKGSFEDIFNSYVERNKSFWYLDYKIPTLDSVRGKIVLFRRFDTNVEEKLLGIYGKFKDNATAPIPEQANPPFLYVQDEYNLPATVGGDIIPVPVGDIKWKLNKIFWLLDRAKSGSKDTWYINYASGVCAPVANPGDIAISINPRLREEVLARTGRCGTVLMDFPSDDDIKALISRNI
ncbi:hypothetical protein C7Y66_15745 [Chroococcidiopsis sp. CCALA 051]|uniref:phosphatidylinositol-specific phospholipase C domain-containing protein n=1 Tax=Chroococcidiopsis sp. CCALA 051 TaxID=869949 RepID=UPI000D0D61FB|nr:phosphatidylinositol-specific phospholipase C domain-containing protein [Chroococcidiopsis sp. CCALA 051]PSM48189.1 hypothetical protein C7Y66_15745 [Chroococcidiopsis sp. CCALA 051]